MTGCWRAASRARAGDPLLRRGGFTRSGAVVAGYFVEEPVLPPRHEHVSELLCWCQRPFGGGAQGAKLTAMFCFVLHQVIENPLRGHIIGRQATHAAELRESHRLIYLEQ